jgi:ATP-dependent RNA helicase DeaD
MQYDNDAENESHNQHNDSADQPAHTPETPADETDAPAELLGPTVEVGSGNEIFEGTKTFADLGLRNSVLKGITACGFEKPTNTQAALVPAILSGRDILGQAKTGTGKTAAFGLPLLNNVSRDVPCQALILAPTRELAIQITGEIEDLGRFTPIRAAAIYGGSSMRGQIEKLEKGVPIVVGTPGRIIDMMERGHLKVSNVKYAILDEVDRMLDIGFRDDIKRILGNTPKDRQTVFVSATISPDIERLARTHMRDAEKIIVHSGSLTVSQVKQFYLTVNPWDKKRLLLHLLRHEAPALTVVFCRLKRHVDEIAAGLSARGINAFAIHGDMPQGKRNNVMQRLRDGELSVLVASDLASRGIDVDGVTHVINFDLPEDPEVYVHRIGRTARAGRSGISWSFVTPDQGELLTNVELLINQEVPRLEYPDFKVSDTPPASWRPPFDPRRDGGLKVVSPNGPATPPPAAAPNTKANRIENAVRPKLPASDAPAAPAAAQAPAAVSQVASGAVPAITVPSVVDASKFPGGIVPTKLPPKMLIRGLRTGKR